MGRQEFWRASEFLHASPHFFCFASSICRSICGDCHFFWFSFPSQRQCGTWTCLHEWFGILNQFTSIHARNLLSWWLISKIIIHRAWTIFRFMNKDALMLHRCWCSFVLLLQGVQKIYIQFFRVLFFFFSFLVYSL